MRLRIYFFSMVTTFVVTVLYLMPGNELPKVDNWDFLSADKWMHFACFMAISVSSVTAFRKQKKFIQLYQNATYITLIGFTIYGVILEILQGLLFTNRYTEITDMIANTFGVFIGIVIYKLVYGKELTS